MNDNTNNLYIYGAGKRGSELFEIVQEFYADKINIRGFIDREKKGTKYNLPIYDLDSIPYDSIIVISIFRFELALEIALNLKEKGFSEIYWYSVENKRKIRINFFLEQCINCSEWSEETLFHVEMHAMDACNLNCIGCTHFSPILKKEKPDLKTQLLNIDLLSKKIASIAQFHILGGEPFLNDEILYYVKKVRETYPLSSIIIVTNGLLIPKLPKNVLKYLAEENISVSISEYEPTHQMIDQIKNVLNQYNVMYYIREARETFNIPLSINKTDEIYCISNGCITIAKGKISRCPTLMYIEDFNKKFNFSFPNEGILDLETEMSGIELKKKLYEAIPLCQYCVKNEVSWGRCGKEIVAEYFVKMND